MQNFRALRAPPTGPRSSGGWGLHPRPQKQSPHCEFLATCLIVSLASAKAILVLGPILTWLLEADIH